MKLQTLRATAVRQALARRTRTPYSAPELQLLTRYVLGSLSLEETNAQLRSQGLALNLIQPNQQPD